MARALLGVVNQVYCTIDIENQPMPATPNLVDKIHVVEGIGQSIPSLELYLYDQQGSLADDLSLFEGKPIFIELGKSEALYRTYEYRVFGLKSMDTHAGQMLKVVCILNCYKFASESNVKAFADTSANAIAQAAGAGGMTFDGPTVTTADKQNWLCVTQTLSSFVEDTALRGFVNDGSCMAHVLTTGGVVRYKDLFEELRQEPKMVFLHNSPKGNNPYPEHIVRQVNVSSRGGVFSNWVNYGYAQYEHDLSGDITSNTSVNAPIVDGFPVNNIRNDMQYARIEHVGFDTGTDAKPGGNVHKNYRKAKYQNLRFRALFTETIQMIVENITTVELFDPVLLDYVEFKNGQFIHNERYSGMYIVANKTAVVKNGIRYVEKLTLIRPSVGNAK